MNFSKKIRVLLLPLAFLFLGLATSTGSARAQDGYEPACQWIRFRGKVKNPEIVTSRGPLLFTATYRFAGQERPATLLTNYPIKEADFNFVFSAFREEIGRGVFVVPMFFFDKRIFFSYSVKSTDGRYQSPWAQSVYHPERLRQDGEVRCQSEIRLDPVVLEEK